MPSSKGQMESKEKGEARSNGEEKRARKRKHASEEEPRNGLAYFPLLFFPIYCKNGGMSLAVTYFGVYKYEGKWGRNVKFAILRATVRA
eukprot:1333322-Amorphochlora_amoeboformis.AAC.2